MKIFPDARKNGEIHFLIAKRLPYFTRMITVSVLIVGGLAVELLINFWAGLVMVAMGSVLGFIQGYHPRPKLVGDTKWGQVTPDEFKKVKSRQDELEDWDVDLFDITNPYGSILFAMLIVIGFILLFVLNSPFVDQFALYLIANTVVLIVPHWLLGTRSFLSHDELIIKIDLLEKISEILKAPSDVQVLPVLGTMEVKDEGKVPMNARLMLRFLNAPEHFFGIQVQVSINTVQGKDFPYLYCVIIAKRGSNFFNGMNNLGDFGIHENRKHSLTLELDTEGDVDILIIRQTTTSRTGYHTKEKTAAYIVDVSTEIARKLLKKHNI